MTSEFNHLIHNNQRRLRFVARKYGGVAHADDVYQEILVQLWRSFGQFRGDAQVSTWLYRIALNAALMWQRKEVKQPSPAGHLPEASEPPGQCQAAILQDFLDSLNEIDSVLLMMHLDDLPAADIASVLGLSVNAVHIRINRLKQKFNDRYVD